MTTINQKEYLRKYLSGGSKDEKKKKRKKKIPVGDRVQIIDDDIDLSQVRTFKEAADLLNTNEDAPQIVGVIDERPPHLRIDDYRKSDLWKPLGANDDDDTQNKESFNKMPTPTRRRYSSDDGDNSPPRKKISDESPPRRKKVDDKGSKNLNNSPPRRSKQGSNSSSSDRSPPRRKKRRNDSSGSDSSPQRKRKGPINNSPPRKRRGSTDNSPPRKRKDFIDNSPPRKRKGSINNSPPRRKTIDDNKPTRRKDVDLDTSPPRRKQQGSNSKDCSPPRKRSADSSPPRRRQSPDSSPPRKCSATTRKSRWDNSDHQKDNSPPRRQQKTTDDNSPPRKSKMRSPSPKSSSFSKPPIEPPKRKLLPGDKKGKYLIPAKREKMTKTLEGRNAGLQSAQQLLKENESFRKREDDLFKNMSAEASGANATTVIRDRKTGKIRDLQKEAEEEREKQKLEEENKAKYSRWGRGLKQVEDYEEKLAQDLHEMNKPLARYADDEDLEKFLKEQEREGDPMLAYIRKKKKKKLVESGKPLKPQYEGEFNPNRFGVRPGYRWDGVDRSNGYEKKWFEVQNSKRAAQEEVYKWSTEDM